MAEQQTIFVFGSNLAGRHGRGAAANALKKWGAWYGVGRGPQGRSYALPTKSWSLSPLPLHEIRDEVVAFLDYARRRPECQFLITRIGCGLAGYTDAQIAPMFFGAPANCTFDPAWAPWGLASWPDRP